ncbi:nucleotidyltransferase domain-containing protein [Pyrococcus horikoshii]|uniref:nucleotidyltransferase domain-containing protein n=1 Tax=Pyrococcus horikoshii TaxID=53953 RepID=UPI00001B56C4|nr:nucleotidyltransferase domain-containing protein [Pyrococcus horikoshii]
MFGSYARDDYDKESDIDVLIVGEVDFEGVIELVTEVLLRYVELISPVLIKPEEFKKRNDSFIRIIKPKEYTLKSN